MAAEGYLLREIELAHTELGHVAFYWERDAYRDVELDMIGMDEVGMPPLVSSSSDEESEDLAAELRLPISKTDYKGTGVRRRLRCNCRRVGRDRCAPRVLWRRRRTAPAAST